MDRCTYCDKAIEKRGGRWRAIESSWTNDAHCHYSARNGQSVEHVPVVEMENVDCGSCGEALMRGGVMTGVSFAVPANGDKGDILCEACARRDGIWEDGWDE